MSQIIRVEPVAKLNLFLEIPGRRHDGYHDIDTVMVPINWRDTLTLRRSDVPGIDLQVHCTESIPNDHRNLVSQALQGVNERLELQNGWRADLTKVIPSGAGLGGASSNAASAIRAALTWLTRYDTRFASAELLGPEKMKNLWHPLAAAIGSDVPFFLDAADAARATGRGETLQPIRMAGPLHFVVIYPPECVSTALVYDRLGLAPGEPLSATDARTSDAMIAAMRGDGASTIADELHNRLQSVTRGLSSRIDQALQLLLAAGLPSAMMTGSGSACFALAQSVSHAGAAADQLARLVSDVKDLQGALIRPASTCSLPADIFNA
ncbi:MAG: 4-(cytidine 5'-diphospho)-2-C-methyl-D-erythritol kinase [Planctomycetota bacterium]